MDFSVTILGSNSAAPAHGRNQSSQLVNWGNHYFLVDCGEATQHQLRKYKVKYGRIDHIFISHLHGDHYLGLMGLISTFHLNNRERELRIYGPKGLDEIITVHLRYSQTRLKFPLTFHPVTHDGKNSLLDLGDMEVYSFPLQHRIPCTGFLFAEKGRPVKLIKEKIIAYKPGLEAIKTLLKGKDVRNLKGEIIYKAEDFCRFLPNRSYAYCSDTIYDPKLIPYIKNVDLLYHEATFMAAERDRAIQTGHSTTEEAADIARTANVKRLLLGHYSVRYSDLQTLLEEARNIFAPSFLSEEGMSYIIR
ncbi:ribonuclease Z [Negadavirga shengliensis]|uniref:Ribonuclease Z n=1 Tax=Negadavirga shengliensis TaxID=1389218 RepID=A0ABV9T759_9BACT